MDFIRSNTSYIICKFCGTTNYEGVNFRILNIKEAPFLIIDNDCKYCEKSLDNQIINNWDFKCDIYPG